MILFCEFLFWRGALRNHNLTSVQVARALACHKIQLSRIQSSYHMNTTAVYTRGLTFIELKQNIHAITQLFCLYPIHIIGHNTSMKHCFFLLFCFNLCPALHAPQPPTSYSLPKLFASPSSHYFYSRYRISQPLLSFPILCHPSIYSFH